MKTKVTSVLFAVCLAAMAGGFWPSVFKHRPSLNRGVVSVRGSQAVARLFAQLDHDHDGRLSGAELEPLLPGGQDAPVDYNDDGFVDQDEFFGSFLLVNNAGTQDESVFIHHELHQSQALLDAGLVQQAAEACKKTVDKYPGSAAAWTMLASVNEKANKIPEAREAHERALKISPGNVDLLAAWSWFCLRHGAPAESNKAVDELLAAMDARLKLAGQGTLRGLEVLRAEDTLTAFINHYQDRAHDPDRALQLLDWGLKRLDGSPRLVALALFKESVQGDRQKALEKARQLAKEGVAAFAMDCLQARILADSGRFKESEQLYREALKHDARFEERQDALVQLYELLVLNKSAPRAEQLLRDQILPATTTIERARRLARRLTTCRVSDLATDQLETVASSASSNPEQWIVLADLREYRGDLAGRKKALEGALAQCGSRADVALEIRALIEKTKPESR